MSVTVVYRSAADLKKSEFWYEEGPKMQERAIKAEAENERYKLMIKSITGGLDECMETVRFLEAENIKLRAVVEAARATKLAFDIAVNYPDKESLHHYNLNNSVYIAVTLLFEALEDLGTDYE